MHLSHLLKKVKKVAMEYSPRNAIPSVSKVDAGMIDLVREFGPQVVSSAPLLQHFMSVWTPEQLQSHIEAAKCLDQTAARAWEWIKIQFNKSARFTEYDIQQFIARELAGQNMTFEGMPIVAVNQNIADPHYTPTSQSAAQVQRGDFILIDLWCKQTHPHAVYADITRVGVAESAPTERQNEIFSIVRRAQKTATDYIQDQLSKGATVKGFEVDEKCRKVIVDAGYGENFLHRTGHNIDKELHGPGANLDGLETFDDRPLIPKTCFSIEPGIYLPGQFGVRLEYDVFIHEDRKISIFNEVQEKIVTLL